MESKWFYKFIVFSDLHKKLLLKLDSEGWSLPSYQPEITHVAVTDHINDFFKKKFQLKTNVLRCCHEIENIRFYEVEALGKEIPLSSDTSWVDPSEISSLEKINSSDRFMLEDWFSTSKNQSFPWFKFGWREEMEKWVEKQLPNGSLTFEQIRSWERSSLFRITSNNNRLYFKAVPDVFSHEPLLSRFLAQNYPSYVPAIIYMEPEQRWYIMQELQGFLLGKSDYIDDWRQALLRLARIQKESIPQTNELKKIKCPVRPVSQIIQTYFETTVNELLNSKEITAETHSKLMASIPKAMSICKLFETSKIPLALEHGDFFGGNVIVQRGVPIIYDWSDCALSHPFLSATVFLEEVGEHFSYEIAESLLDDYVNEWAVFDSKDRLHEEYRLLKSIAPIFYLSVYQSFIFPVFKDNWDKSQIINQYIEKWLSIFERF